MKNKKQKKNITKAVAGCGMNWNQKLKNINYERKHGIEENNLVTGRNDK